MPEKARKRPLEVARRMEKKPSMIRDLFFKNWIGFFTKESSRLFGISMEIKNVVGVLTRTHELHLCIQDTYTLLKAGIRNKLSGEVFFLNHLSDAITIAGLVLKIPWGRIMEKVQNGIFDQTDQEAYWRTMDLAWKGLSRMWRDVLKEDLAVDVHERKMVDFSSGEVYEALAYPDTHILLIQEDLFIQGFPESFLLQFIPLEFMIKLLRRCGKNPFVEIEQFMGEKLKLSYEELGATEEEKKEAEKKVVLIVEDTASVRKILCYFLEEAGFEIIEASSGKEALSILHRTHVDAILLDIMMPDMDGFTLCREITKDSSTSKIPIIICSAKGTREAVVEAMKLGARDYIVKPFTKSTIISRVRKALG